MFPGVIVNIWIHRTEFSWPVDIIVLPCNQEIHSLLWKKKCSLPCSQQPITRPFRHSYELSPCATSQFFKIHFNIVQPSTSRSSKWPFWLMLPIKNPSRTSRLPSTCHMRNIGPSYWYDHPNNISWAVSWSFSLCILLQSTLISSLLEQNTFVKTLISNTVRLLPPSMSETKLYTHTTQHAKL